MYKIQWFLPSSRRDYDNVVASQWIRAYQLWTPLEELGFLSEQFRPGSAADFLYLLRPKDDSQSDAWRQASKSGRKKIFDISTNYLSADTYGYKEVQISRRLRDYHLSLIRSADLVTCSSLYLADLAGRYNKNAVYVPDSVGPDFFRHNPSGLDSRDYDVAWVGVFAKFGDLERLIPMLESMNARLLVLTDNPLPARRILKRTSLRGFLVQRWKYRTAPSYVSRARIGLVPRSTESEYNLAVSSHKIAIFLSTGTPVVASPIPAYIHALERGGGFIARQDTDWRDAVGELLLDSGLWYLASSSAREEAAAFDTRKTAELLARHLESLMT